MLPDFPEVRKYADKFLEKWFHNRLVGKTGILQKMPAHTIPEGNSIELHRQDGSAEKVFMKASKSELRLHLEDFQQRGLAAVFEALDKTAEDIAEKQTRFFFQRFEEICQKSRQTYDAKGQPLSWDLIINLLEHTEVDFDEQGHPILPTIVSAPGLKEQFNQLDITDDQNRRFSEIIEEKRVRWRDREGNRRLVS